jgi:hypothetical protein
MFQGIVLIIPNDCPTGTGRVFCCQKGFFREDEPGEVRQRDMVGGVIKTVHID